MLVGIYERTIKQPITFTDAAYLRRFFCSNFIKKDIIRTTAVLRSVKRLDGFATYFCKYAREACKYP
jgi:hypothetical protein